MSVSNLELIIRFRAGCIKDMCVVAVRVRYIGSATLLQTYHKVRVVVSCAEDLGFDDQLGGWLASLTSPLRHLHLQSRFVKGSLGRMSLT
jgi:hypothetical protein